MISMRNLQFDPFGEPLQAGRLAGNAGSSKLVLRLGTGLFWSLVGVIVVARVLSYHPEATRAFAALVGQTF